MQIVSDVNMYRFYCYPFFNLNACMKLEIVLGFLAQIGHLPKGINPQSVTKLYFGGHYFSLALKVGIITGVLALTVSDY